jgi:hypothetical protein
MLYLAPLYLLGHRFAPDGPDGNRELQCAKISLRIHPALTPQIQVNVHCCGRSDRVAGALRPEALALMEVFQHRLQTAGEVQHSSAFSPSARTLGEDFN